MDKRKVSRRSVATGIGLTLAASTVARAADAQEQRTGSSQSSGAADKSEDTPKQNARLQIGMLLYPGLSPLDLVGPQAFLSNLPSSQGHLLWKSKEPVATTDGYSIVPTTATKDCPRDLDVLFVPGGADGTCAMMEDQEVLAFLADRGSRARYVTSVCTGSLILGAAGLLKGYKATSHWRFRSLLPMFGATPVEERVVIDRNRMTGGGVTAGVDFGLVLASTLSGREQAEAMQLALEYDPHPPFTSGSPQTAPPAIEARVFAVMTPLFDEAQAAAQRYRERQTL